MQGEALARLINLFGLHLLSTSAMGEWLGPEMNRMSGPDLSLLWLLPRLAW
mgnify:CR=1 FL=1